MCGAPRATSPTPHHGMKLAAGRGRLNAQDRSSELIGWHFSIARKHGCSSVSVLTILNSMEIRQN